MIDPPRTALVIFDCDGVLIDSEPIANRVLAERLATVGLELPVAEVMRGFVGRTRGGCIELAESMLGRPLPPDFGPAWDAALFAALEREVRPVEGIVAVLEAMVLPWCVASNGERDRMTRSLAAAGLARHVGTRLHTASEVARPKPAPDLFLHAARTYGADPKHCVVVEDTVTGVRAGAAAGMRVLGYAGAAHSDPAGLEAAGARVFRDMAELPRLFAAP